MGRGPSPLTNRGEEPTSPVPGPSDATLLGALARTRRRLRLARIARSLGSLSGLALGFGFASAALFFGARSALWVPLVGFGCAFAVSVLRAFRYPQIDEDALLRLERASGAPGDPLRTWHWAREGSRAADPFVAASLARLWRESPVLDPVRAVPIPLKGASAFLACALGSIGLFLAAGWDAGASAPVNPAAERVAAPGFAGSLRAAVATLRPEVTSDEGRRLLEEVERLASRAERGELGREEGLRALSAEARRLLEGGSGERALAEELARRGESFSKHAPTRGVGAAFSERRLEEVAKALEALADRLGDPRAGLDERELEELRRALDAERAEREQRSAAEKKALETERAGLAEKLRELDERAAAGALSAEEKREQEARRRRVEELDRRTARPPAEELDELDRQLAEAAAALRDKRSPKDAARFLERAADSAKKLSSKRLTEAEKRRLLEELRRLEEKLQKEGEEGSSGEATEDFERRARGQPGEDAGAAAGTGTPIEIPVPGGSPETGSGEGEGEGAKEGDGAGEGTRTSRSSSLTASEPGVDHEPETLLGEPESPRGRAEDTVAVAPEAGEGPTESETIRAAAEAGFTRSAYRSLYREYESAMEEVLDRERVPRGRRAQIERYFDLIRPRGARTVPEKRERP